MMELCEQLADRATEILSNRVIGLGVYPRRTEGLRSVRAN
jgi:hypothetical protein